MNWEAFFLIAVGVPLLLAYVLLVPVYGAEFFSDKFNTPIAGFIWLFISIVLPLAFLVAKEY